MDVNVPNKEDEKCRHYTDLVTEIRKMYKVQTEIVPIVVGTLGTVPTRLPGYVK